MTDRLSLQSLTLFLKPNISSGPYLYVYIINKIMYEKPHPHDVSKREGSGLVCTVYKSGMIIHPPVNIYPLKNWPKDCDAFVCYSIGDKSG